MKPANLKKLKNYSFLLLFATAGLLVMQSASAQTTNAISWHYNNYSTVNGTNVAGVVPVDNWVDSWADGNPTNSLWDNTRKATTLGISYASDYGGWFLDEYNHPGQDASGTYNKELLNGYLNGGSSSVAISGIPYSSYNIIVYFSSDTAGRAGTITVGSTTNYFTTMGLAENSGANAVFTQATDTTGSNPTTNADYAIFSGLAGPSQAIMCNVTGGGGIAGFEVLSNAPVAGAPSVVATVNPTNGIHGQSFTVTATVTPGAGTVTNVSVDLSSIGGSASASLVLSSANVYTNTFTIQAGAPLVAASLTVTATDTAPLTGSAWVSFTVLPGSVVWDGSSTAGNAWSDSANWLGNVAPLPGDYVAFDGTTRPTPDMDANYSVSGLVFSNTAGSFTIGSSTGSTLTIGSGGITNNSANVQTLNVPIVLGAAQTFSTVGGLTLNSNLTGGAALTLPGAGTTTLAGTGTSAIGNLYVTSGLLKVAAGTVTVGDSSGNNTKIDNGGSVEVDAGATLTVNAGGGGWFPVNDTSGTTSTLTINGGTFNLVDNYGIEIPRQGNAILNINSGTMTVNDQGGVGLIIGDQGSAQSGTVNLNGGTLVVNKITSSAGTDAFNFNGGTLSPVSANTFFPSSGTLTANVRNGGAIVDTAGHNAEIDQALLHSTVGGDNAIDGGLTKIGSGTLTLAGANTYTGNTTISNDTLALVTGGSISSSNIIVDSGTTFDVSGLANYTLNSGQNLEGSGSVGASGGSMTAASGSAIYPGTDGTVGTLVFNENLTLNGGATAHFDLSTTYDGANDYIDASGGNLTLNGNAIHIKAPSSLVNLDTNADYVLITAYNIYGICASIPVWDVAPANSNNFIVVVDTTGYYGQVRLHYTTLTPPIASGVASPSPAFHNQNVLISVTVTNGSGTVDSSTGVVLNASSLDASLSSVSLVLSSTISSTIHVFTNTITVPTSALAGDYTLLAAITDSNGLIGSANISLAVNTTEVWNGHGGDQNWDTSLNWVSTLAPELTGDSLVFAGSTQTSPNMETSYTVNGLTFSNNAASFTIGSASSSTLTLTANGIVNNSTNAQTLNVPVSMGAPQTFNSAAGDIAISGAINDSSSGYALTKTGNHVLNLSGNNAYTGPTTVSAGTLNVSSAGTVSSSGTTTVGNTAGNAVLVNSGSLSQLNFNVGTVSGAVGAIYQNAGTVRQTQGGAGNDFQIGNAAGAYGYYYAGGGTLNVNEIGVAGEGGAGNGIMEINGATVNDAGWFVMSRTGSAQTGELNIYSGSLTFAGGGLQCNWGSGQTSIINVMGGTLSAAGDEAIGFSTSGTCILNLNGGVTTARAVNWWWNSPAGQVNFNGGSFIFNSAVGGWNDTLINVPGNIYVYGGGATIGDNAGGWYDVSNPLAAPAGNGIYSATVTSGGAGYIAPPIVIVTNAVGDTAGSGATAIAQINPLTGAVTNVIITCPGVNYTATPVFVLSGGGAATPAVITGGALVANTSGGLTKSGTGTLQLDAINTYTGATVVNGGTLDVVGSNANASSTTINSNGLIQLVSDAQLGVVPASPAVNITLNGGGISKGNSTIAFAANRTVLLGAGGGYFAPGYGQDLGINGLITGTGGLGIDWEGGSVTLNAVNNYQGDTTIGTNGPGYWGDNGANVTLKLGIDNALPYGAGNGNVVFGTSVNNNTPKLDLNGHNVQMNGLTGSANATIDNTVAGAYALTVGNNGQTSTFGGVIKNSAGTLALTKTGNGTLTLSGANTYTGNTTVNGGTLEIVQAALATNSTVSIAGGAVLQLDFSTTNQIAALVLNGVTNNTPGVYGSNNVPAITGSGSLLVPSPAPPVSTDASLLSLALSPLGTLSPAFVTGTTNYTAIEANSNSLVTVLVTNTSSYATNVLFLNGAPQATNAGLLTASVPLVVGPGNVIQVVVTAQDGVTTSTNTVTVTRLASSNALLASLSISPGTLYPTTFSSDTMSYNATNTYLNNPVTVTATSADTNATLALSFNNGGSIPLTSGVASGNQTLVLPTNTLAVTVVSQDLSQTNTYTVNVLLQPSQTVPKLTNSVSGNNLVLSWPADHLGYQLLVQTNNLNKGVSANISDWGTVAGSTTNTSMSIPIIKATKNAYYRLVYP